MPWNAAWDAEVQSEVQDALEANNLDHLMKTAVANNADMTTEVTDGTVLSNILSKTSDTSSYTVADDSLEAISDATGGSASVTWECRATSVYNNTTDTLQVAAWLDQNGETVTGPTSATINFRKASDGSLLFTMLSDAAPDAQGIFYMTKAAPGFTADTAYYMEVAIINAAVTRTTDVGLTANN